MLQLKPDAEQVKEEILTKSTVIIRYRKAFIANFVTTTMNLCHLRCIYATFILGKALLNSGTRTNNIGHSMLDFCRVKANFSTRVPKNLSGPKPPQEVVSARLKRGPRAETRGNLVPRVFALTTLPRKRRLWGRKWALGRQILYFSREERWPRKIRRIVAQFASRATMPQTC